MFKLVHFAIAALSISAASAAFAQADDDIAPVLACEVIGYDVVIYNRSAGPIAAGTEVQWSVPGARRDGNHTLVSALEPFIGLYLTGALGRSYVGEDAARPCVAQAVAESRPVVSCEVMGHDVIIYNRSIGPIIAGTEVHWSVRFARKEGNHTLAAALEPGKGLYLTSALGGDYLWDRPCVASIAEEVS